MRKGISPPDQYNERLAGINLLDVVYDNLPVITEDHDWRHELGTLAIAGVDTIHEALSLLLVTLGNYPDVQNKVFMEIQEVMGDLDRDVTVKDTNAMTYLNQVILESLRLNGSIPAIIRKATKDIKLVGCTLPAGSRIIIALQAMGFDKEQFPNPKQFLPERFSPEKQKERHNYAFLPFSAGPRNCIGKSYAMLMMKTVLVHVLRRLRVTSHTKLSDIKYDLKVVLHHTTPILVSFHPR
uniref:Cytochrome P450 n=2 Tax=Cuerna arida TaxID=1464854 RepID=A0A1B6EKA3_9HEMI